MNKFVLLFSLSICAITPLSLADSISAAKQNSADAPNNLNALTMCIDHYPPLQVIKPNGDATGENVEITRMFFSQFGYQLKFTADIPFKRCLQWLKEGVVDVMTGLLDSPERQKDYHMFLYDDLTVKAFFVKEGGPEILQFSDLEGLNIAVVRGARQLEQFDNAPPDMFQKTIVSTLTAAFGMLARNRVDAVVCTDYYGENVIKSHPNFIEKIVKSPYEVVDGTKVYIALSRKSVFADQAKYFESRALEMYESGEFKQFIKDFQVSHPEYY